VANKAANMPKLKYNYYSGLDNLTGLKRG